MSILNYIKVCEKNVAGNMYLFLTEAANVFNVVVTAGEVTDIVMTGVATFKEIQADQNGLIRQVKQLGSQGKEYYEHFVNFVCGKASKELNTLADSLSEASPCGIVAIVMDSNGQAWLVGWNETDEGDRPLFLNTDNFTSGKDLTEVEGGKRTFDLKTISSFLDLPLDSTLNDYIKSEIMLGLGNAITLGFTSQIPPVLSDGNTVAWFDLLENITKDGSDFVSVWGDKSGNGNDLLQAVGTNQPLWSANGVLFDGVDNFMEDSFTYEQPEMIYIVVKQIVWGTADYIFDGFITNGGVFRQKTGGASPQVEITAGALLLEDLTHSVIGTFQIVRALFNGANSSLQIDDNAANTGVDIGSNDMDGFTLARAGSFAGQWSNIEVKEVILRKIADGATDQGVIYDYLESKYGL